MRTKTNDLAEALSEALRVAFVSPNEADSNGEAANIVDAIASAGRNIRWGLETLAKAVEKRGVKPDA